LKRKLLARSEAMKKQRITQIDDGKNGFLVSSVEEAAKRIVQVVKNKRLRERLGKNARDKVRRHFLLTRYMEQYLDLFNSFETIYRLKH